MNNEELILFDTFKENGYLLSEKQVKQFYDFYVHLVQRNKEMNLTGITEFHDVLVKHFLDSVILLEVLEDLNFSKNGPFLDIGTGAGFPGIPLKIMLPDESFVLLDSLQKRIGFLGEVKDLLSLGALELVHSRAEDFVSESQLRAFFPYVVSRAVADLAVLSEYALPFVKENGFFIAYKSGDCEEEIQRASFAISVLGGKLVKVIKKELPDGMGSRSFVVIQKIKETPKKYPRKAGTPMKMPLIKG